MLRTNLSTRPFYNQRAVRAVLSGLTALALGLTLFNAYETLRLRGQNREARDTIAQNEAKSRELRDQAAQVRKAIDRTRLEAVQTAAREANALIDRRTFSWTELLNQFQATLPADVRIGGVMPQVDSDGRRLVQVTVFSRRIEDLEQFMDALDKTGVFSGVLSRADRPEDGSGLRSEIQAYYDPSTVRRPPASESGKGTAGNAAPGNVSAEAPR